MRKKRPSTRAWIVVHIISPLLPFFLEGSIRLMISKFNLYWDTFSASTLAMSYGLLLVFIEQSLVNQKTGAPLMNEDKIAEIKFWSDILRSVVIFFYVPLFTLIVAFEYMATYHSIPIAKELTVYGDVLVFTSSAFVIPISLIVRSIFNLKTVVL
jgi:hypothetical protein